MIYLTLRNEATASQIQIRDTIEPGKPLGELEIVFTHGLLEMSVTLSDEDLHRIQAALNRDGCQQENLRQ